MDKQKLLLLTDTHLGLYNSSDIWLDVTLNLFKEVADVCLTRDISAILHLGDFFDEKKSTNQKTLDYAYAIADTIPKSTTLTIITGNHDIYYKEVLHPSSLKCFRNISNIQVITESMIMDKTFSLVPWRGDVLSEGKYCFGHFDITSFNMNDVSTCRNGKYSIEDFKQFKQVYSGHFHTPSTKDNIIYIGSAFQQTFNDVGSSRGYYIWDDGDLEFIEYKSAPKFIKLSTEEPLKNIEGNIVKLIYAKDYGTNQNNKILEEVERHNPLKLTTNFTNIESDDIIKDDEDISLLKHEDIVKEWIEKDKKVPENVNKNILLQMMYKMMKEEGE
jgi:DNA repair exonuclease SbcCD nuclease subunit